MLRPGVSVALLLLLLSAVVACGSDDGATTQCGQEPSVQECDRATQICVESNLPTGVTFECVALPDGCDDDRTCADCGAACQAPTDACGEPERDNTLTCSCLACL